MNPLDIDVKNNKTQYENISSTAINMKVFFITLLINLIERSQC